jgi:hypothetical protein
MPHLLDLQTFVEMAKYARNLAKAEPLKVRTAVICRILAKSTLQSMIVQEVNPGAEVTTDEHLTSTSAAFHIVAHYLSRYSQHG